MFIIVEFCFLVKRRSFQLLSDFLRTGRTLIFLDFFSFSFQMLLLLPQPAHLKLTILYFQEIRNLNDLACLPQNVYLCIGNDRKGSISRMSDECLMKQETVFSFYTQYQAVIRKFTLARESYLNFIVVSSLIVAMLIGFKVSAYFSSTIVASCWMMDFIINVLSSVR